MATRTGLERQPITNGVVDRVTFQFFSEEEVGVPMGIGCTITPDHSVLLRLLRAVCLHCYRFKMAHEAIQRYAARLKLVAEGRLVEAMGQPGGGGRPSKLLEELSAGIESPSKPSKDQQTPSNGSSRPCNTHVALLEEALTALRVDFFKEQPSGKCANCGCHNPSVKQFSNTKLFMTRLKPAATAANAARGVSIRAMDGGGALTVEDIEAHAVNAVNAVNAKRRQAKEDPSTGEIAFGSDSDSEEDMSQDGPVKDVKALESAGIQRRRVESSTSQAARAAGGEDGGALTYLPPSEVQAMAKRLWETNYQVLRYLFCAGPGSTPGTVLAAPPDGWRMLFVQVLPVPPNMFRRPSRVGDGLYEHAQNTILTRVLNLNIDLSSAMGQPLPPRVGGRPVEELTPQEQARARLTRCLQQWLQLQEAVNNLMDSSKVKTTRNPVQGIKQVLEKKEGIFRMHMMGKRVNFAARSVISPDPYIGTDEIGIPAGFAMTLSFPERVTAWNVARLREAVERGAHQWPGAVAVEVAGGGVIHLDKLNAQRRRALAKQLLTGVQVGPKSGRGRSHAVSPQGSTIVHRHMADGDLMLTNRQPTLHKPGLMAHCARIFHTEEKTIRLHYANCSTFNADFDGDEINLHLPQDQLGRAEGYGIVHANHQYIVPTAGSPIRGLIQDHVLAGVLMTMRDSFFTRPAVSRLVYAALTNYSPLGAATLTEQELVLEVPAVCKPCMLWTGKQIITTVLKHLTRGVPPLTMRSKCKTPPDYLGKQSGEAEMVVFRSTLVQGVLDKAAYGKFGLVHAFHELYGGKSTDQLLNALSRLLTHFLQMRGFTCGMDDLYLTAKAETTRAAVLDKVPHTAAAAAAKYLGMDAAQKLLADAATPAAEAVGAVESVRAAVAGRWGSLQDGGAAYDMTCSGSLHPLASEVVKACIPSGQRKRFPLNCMSLMTSTGAKGSIVNFSQISCLLGQQELEGRRVPRLPNGRTLPCFEAYDPTGRADGFISDRFLTGLRPQEFYFHCMAGREGLVDTTVKTARSGYLQRCIIKNLEALRCHYDGTVRNDTDGSMVQFSYGEDGVDVMDTAYLTKFDFAAANAPAMAAKLALAKHQQRGLAIDPAISRDTKAMLDDGNALPVMAQYPPSAHGVVSHSFAAALQEYVASNPDGLLQQPGSHNRSGACMDPDTFATLMRLRYLHAMAQPGEAVGVVAGQSIGEPSTQMTLNTFHMAGRGEANVTLGIPRLRELFMTASQEIKTPVMTLPLRHNTARADAQTLVNKLRRIRFAEALRGLRVSERLAAFQAGVGRRYEVLLELYAAAEFPADVDLPFSAIKRAAEKQLLPKLRDTVARQLRGADRGVPFAAAEAPAAGGRGASEGGKPGGEHATGDAAAGAAVGEADENTSSSDDEDADPEGAKDAQRSTATRTAYRGDADDEALQQAAMQEDEVVADDEGAEGGEGPPEGGGGDVARDTSKSMQTELEVDEVARTVRICLTVPLDAPRLLMLELAEKVMYQVPIRAVAGIERCFLVEAAGSDCLVVQTDGINLQGAWMHDDVISVDEVTCNSVATMLETYGVEAARATLVAEVSSVFGAYGIGVDRRHLGLIADHMTQQGGYRPCNRIGMQLTTSPLLKMSFETASQFLTDASVRGACDGMASPASRIAVGRPVECGTGCMDLVMETTPAH